MIEVPVTKVLTSFGLAVYVDTEDYIKLGKPDLTTQYSRGELVAIKLSTKPQKPLAVAIMEPVPEGMLVDHRDRDVLNNRKSNLRFATYAENARNSASKQNLLLKRKLPRGVHARTNGQYQACIRFNGDLKYLGQFVSVEEAEQAYKKASLLYFKEFSPFYNHQAVYQ